MRIQFILIAGKFGVGNRNEQQYNYGNEGSPASAIS